MKFTKKKIKLKLKHHTLHAAVVVKHPNVSATRNITCPTARRTTRPTIRPKCIPKMQKLHSKSEEEFSSNKVDFLNK
uniref:Uncharacterized protein n=1 Tax=Glossina brevipalpis TaxID=37001 RepID=A0A1A9WM52_9MUSC